MKGLKTIIHTPKHDTVEVEYKGERYKASEEDIRYLQLECLKDNLNSNDFKVFDVDKNGDEYELEFRDDFKFYNEFSCNIFSYHFELVKPLIFYNREKQNKK